MCGGKYLKKANNRNGNKFEEQCKASFRLLKESTHFAYITFWLLKKLARDYVCKEFGFCEYMGGLESL